MVTIVEDDTIGNSSQATEFSSPVAQQLQQERQHLGADDGDNNKVPTYNNSDGKIEISDAASMGKQGTRKTAGGKGQQQQGREQQGQEQEPFLPPYVTTSSVLERLNDNLNKLSSPDDLYKPKFELQKRLPDGSAIPCDENDLAASDLQTKIQQSAQIVASLPTLQMKYEWAEQQRLAGNVYFNQGDYKSAMDIYLTCLLVVDKSKNDSKNVSVEKVDHDDDDEDIGRLKIDAAGRHKEERKIKNNSEPQIEHTREFITQVYTPVLNNLAQCTLQLGMYKKTISFCNFGLEHEQKMQQNQDEWDDQDYMLGLCKLHYKRGKARRLKGDYKESRIDLQHAMGRLQDLTANVDTANEINYQVYEKAIQKEFRSLEQAEREGRRNRQRAKMAMQKVLSSPPTPSSTAPSAQSSSDNSTQSSSNHQKFKDDESGPISNSEPRKYSKLRSRKKSNVHSSDNESDVNGAVYEECDKQLSFSQYYWVVVARVAEQLLEWIGDDSVDHNHKSENVVENRKQR